MPLQNFVDGTTPTIKAAWLNLIDTFYTTLFAGATTAAAARTAISAAKSGANSDITGLSGLNTNVPLAGAKLTGLGAGSAAGDSVRWEQLASSLTAAQWVAAAGTADAITAAYSPVNTTLPDGLILCFRASAANATTTPTFAPDGLTAHTITKQGGKALGIGDIPGALAECIVRYNLANTRWELLNITGIQGSFTITITGMTAGVTGTAVYSITNNVVTLYIPVLTGTSNTTAMTATGLPAAITPATIHTLAPAIIEDNTATIAASTRVDINTNNTITFYVSHTSATFTNSGTKGLPVGATFTYNLN